MYLYLFIFNAFHHRRRPGRVKMKARADFDINRPRSPLTWFKWARVITLASNMISTGVSFPKKYI